MSRPPTFQGQMAQDRIEKIRIHLTERAMAVPELAALLFCAPKTAEGYIRHLRPQIHVESWTRVTGMGHRNWRWGIKADTPPPPAQTIAQTSARHKAKLKRERPQVAKERAAQENERKRRKYRAKVTRPFRDPFVAMFYGGASAAA